ncbi:MAG TPA: hypothetical protein VKP69_06805 [Isosphaeraceae bacterium]|nr:hypothetical protein [Isosphaeraceae bacterium]
MANGSSPTQYRVSFGPWKISRAHVEELRQARQYEQHEMLILDALTGRS